MRTPRPGHLPVGNKAPVVSAGANQVVNYTNTTVGLSGYVSDDGNPNPPSLVTSLWTKVSGPGTVTFGNAAQTNTTAHLVQPSPMSCN